MKKVIVFISGFVVGIVVTFLVLFFISLANKPDDGLPGLTIFPEKGECITSKGGIEIFQVLAPNMALANTVGENITGEESIEDLMKKTQERINPIVVLIVNNEDKTYYDGQRIEIPANKCARQIGTYQYTTKQDNFEKTVPAVVIE